MTPARVPPQTHLRGERLCPRTRRPPVGGRGAADTGRSPCRTRPAGSGRSPCSPSRRCRRGSLWAEGRLGAPAPPTPRLGAEQTRESGLPGKSPSPKQTGDAELSVTSVGASEQNTPPNRADPTPRSRTAWRLWGGRRGRGIERGESAKSCPKLHRQQRAEEWARARGRGRGRGRTRGRMVMAGDETWVVNTHHNVQAMGCRTVPWERDTVMNNATQETEP